MVHWPGGLTIEIFINGRILSAHGAMIQEKLNVGYWIFDLAHESGYHELPILKLVRFPVHMEEIRL